MSATGVLWRQEAWRMTSRTSRLLSAAGLALIGSALTADVTAAERVAWSAIRPMIMHAQASQTAAASPERALVNRYCVTCHNERRKLPEGAPLLLDHLDPDQVSGNAQIWEKVVRKVRSGAMPPAGMPRPDLAMLSSWLKSLETALDRASAANLNPGRPASVHRLNRAEYTNAIRDLLALDVDGRALLPPDDAGYG